MNGVSNEAGLKEEEAKEGLGEKESNLCRRRRCTSGAMGNITGMFEKVRKKERTTQDRKYVLSNGSKWFLALQYLYHSLNDPVFLARSLVEMEVRTGACLMREPQAAQCL